MNINRHAERVEEETDAEATTTEREGAQTESPDQH